ncbi:hypothetical protein RN001_007610 [Aquatica leii]|uniref:Luciferin 4-monooxygenase-like n=1 Tax=Aquatica leii TaxID=1421715 RepID=A0AAN7SGW7_9COLE|nr:hypothetical protein RN001_007610 [Aquatica leii]
MNKTGIIEVPGLDYNLDPLGYGHFLYNHMINHKHKIAQVDARTRKNETYQDLLERCVRTALYLKKIGVQPGDFISLCTYNHLDACVPVISAFFINAIMSAVDPSLSLEDTVHLLQQTKPKVIFALSESIPMIESVINRIGTNTTVIVFDSNASHIPFSSVLAACTKNEISSFSPTPVKSLDDIAIVFFSSGTTGLSKGICHKHYSLFCQSINNAESGFNFDLSFGYYSPYWTVYVTCLCTSIITGTARLIVPKFDKFDPWEPFYHKPNYVILNVFQSLTLCIFPKPEEVDLSFVKVVLITGGVIQSDQIEELQKIFVDSKIYLLYGQSEVFGYLAHFTPKDEKLLASKRNSVGFGRPGISYKIVDLDSRMPLGPNKIGELCVKTKFAMVGYHNMDSSVAWDSNGWLKTGDVVYYDDYGCFYVVERIKEMFKYQGWHVTPSVIETVLLQHPAVASAVVLGAVHKYDGHRPIGIVVLKPGYENVNEAEIQNFVDDKVENRLKLRAGLKFVDRLPMTASGKINRWRLKANLGI